MRRALGTSRVKSLVEELFAEDLHHKRVLALSNAVTGCIQAGALGVHAIGRGLAVARSRNPKHAVKQVSRFVGNKGIQVHRLFARWVPYVAGKREELWVALDWTDFHTLKNKMSTLTACVISKHGRATPLVWLSAKTDELSGQRAEAEDALLSRLKDVLPPTVKRVVILADRGFGDFGRIDAMTALGFDYVVRLKKDVFVENAKGEVRHASAWVAPEGRITSLRNARVTGERNVVGTFVAVHQKGMKDAWLLASSVDDIAGTDIIKRYGRRFTIEESFRDIKDIRFGMGLRQARVPSPERLDRLFLLSALTIALLTLLGAAGEAAGIDRLFKVNTSKKRQYSLFRQGCDYYEFLPTMKDAMARPLLEEFSRRLAEQKELTDLLGNL